MRDVQSGRFPRPLVLVLGGFLTAPPLYRPFVRRLRAAGAADVVVASVWTMDWLIAVRRGLGPILTRSGRALLEASSRSAALSGGAPVLIVGHSAGGMIARLLTSPEPYAGRALGASGRIGAIVTLGTPHDVGPGVHARLHVGSEAAAFAARVVPGPAFAPRVGYLAVGSDWITARPDGARRERRRWRAYRSLAPVVDPAGIPGDGLVPVACSVLPGAPSLVLDGVAHGQGDRDPWYGADAPLAAWWPLAVEAWRGALRARVGSRSP